MGRFGRIDTVVNSAGLYIGKPFTDYTDQDFDLIVGVNLRGMNPAMAGLLAAIYFTQGKS
ncbi:SDR family NAD(P)-dependent oxidoreductase [Streptomyces platensis]